MGCLFLDLAPEMVVSLFCRIHLSHEFVFVHFEQQSSQKHRYSVKNGGGMTVADGFVALQATELEVCVVQGLLGA
jgi:hypothetical protein